MIGLPGNQFTSEILPELTSIKEKGQIRIVDLLYLSKDAAGLVTLNEVSEQSPEDLATYGTIPEDLIGVLNEADIQQLAANIPANTSAVIVVLEHIWVLGLTAAIGRAGGVVFTGGLVAPAELTQLNAELVEMEVQNA